MDCYCRSKELYARQYLQPHCDFQLGDNRVSTVRLFKANQQPCKSVAKKVWETSELWLPIEIERVTWEQVAFNPSWFQNKFVAKNIPCVVTGVLSGDDIFERWSDSKYLQQIMQDSKQTVSLSPDGFADSIKGEYFVEPHEQLCTIKQFFESELHFPGAVPYIQHQNSNLTEQFSTLNAELSQEVLRHVSQSFFKGRHPDAQNIWLGYDQSVSSLHKDPYENFYMPLCGEKHFTLLPPIAILNLQQGNFKSAKESYSNGCFTCKETGRTVPWILPNPDLAQDVQRFSELQNTPRYHVVLRKEEMLYLPSLWYHQVAQCCGKDPYALAINYWFDMQFGQNYTLYETCRALKALSDV